MGKRAGFGLFGFGESSCFVMAGLALIPLAEVSFVMSDEADFVFCLFVCLFFTHK